MKKIFGKSNEEISVEDNAKAREIVQVVLEYGINQQQILQMIFLLALELENNIQMKEITNLIKTFNKADKPQNSIITGE
tara:strand:+ start:3152 stop:3388 length:237 start_codon:yes stop_codon:yes gene_type:complete